MTKQIMFIIASFIVCSCNLTKKQDSKKDISHIETFRTVTDFMDAGFSIVDSTSGDLNKDNHSDFVSVLELKTPIVTKNIAAIFIFDTITNSFNKPILSESLIKNSDNISSLEEILIKNQTLRITQSLNNGWFTTIFRLQKGQWKLIGFVSSIRSNEYFYEVDYNLNTDEMIVTKEVIGSDYISNTFKYQNLIKSVPTFESYVPFAKSILLEDNATIYY